MLIQLRVPRIDPTARAGLSVLVAGILCVDSAAARPRTPGAFYAETPVTRRPSLKEQVLEIPDGSQIEVRFKNKEKLRGRLTEISAEAFTIKYAKGSKIDERKINFADVKSIKAVEGGSRARPLTYILAGAGITFVVLAVIGLVLSHAN